MKKNVTLYLVDDHQIIIDGLRLLISNEDHIKIVGSSNDGEIACTELLDRKPDLALVDFSMPKSKLDGLELILTLRKKLPDTKFIVLSTYDHLTSIKAAQRGGASGYIIKNANKTELMKCLNAVLAGETYFPDLKAAPEEQDKSLFTPRELEIVKMIIDGRSSSEIASKLHISQGTVDAHRKNINRKTDTNTPLGLDKFLKENQIKL
jgi:two-component system nitrate/nitrite response regulator NarL